MFLLKKNRALLACLLTAMVLIVAVGAGYAAGPGEKKYPNKAVTIIVPFATGGGVDLTGRLVADILSKEWGVPVNIVNKEGGNTIIGTLEVMKSKPDGYTVLADNLASASLQVIMPDLPYKPFERTPLAACAGSTSVFAVNGKSPWKNLRDVADAAKNNPENFKWGSLGGVSVADLRLFQFFSTAGINFSHAKKVKFKGAGDAVLALAGGHIDFTAAGVPAVVNYLQSGKVRVVGVTAPVKTLPDAKTLQDQGFQGVFNPGFEGYSGPPGVPKSVVSVWEKALEKMSKSPEYAERIEKIGYSPLFWNSDEYRRVIMSEAQMALKYFGIQEKK
jgi:tripartite-type tricarboxylate transporter receptor subunit TctC